LSKANPALYAQYKAPSASKFLFLEPVNGLDGTKLAEVQSADAAKRTPDQKIVADASIAGDRRTLKADSFIPATMAVIYLLILLYFKSIGGYRPVTIETEPKPATVPA
jgi:DHA2 family metal-tetracycline-proton antiporter-like MFS transporter